MVVVSLRSARCEVFLEAFETVSVANLEALLESRETRSSTSSAVVLR
ncbi:Uncharacterised protein [Mycobacteroides abscessus subsp. abscessus]|nr:Uncharacterised protein [Mycobacteroides abscessus subsp. abscessus]